MHEPEQKINNINKLFAFQFLLYYNIALYELIRLSGEYFQQCKDKVIGIEKMLYYGINFSIPLYIFILNYLWNKITLNLATVLF